MSTLSDLLSKLADLDIRVWADNGKLRLNAPPGTVTPELQTMVRLRRDDLLSFLEARDKPKLGHPLPADGPASDIVESRLGPGQERLYALARHDSLGSVYNVPMVFRVKGELDIAALEKSLSLIQQRHDALRLVFKAGPYGAPLQRIADAIPVWLPVHDLRTSIAGLDTAKATAKVRREINAEVNRPIDLEKGPPWRALVFRLGSRDHVLAFTMHHIVFDGASKPIFLSELAQAYGAYRDGRDPTLAPVSRGFVASVAAEISAAARTSEADRKFWSGQFAGGTAPLMLPNDRPRAPHKGNMASIGFELPEYLISRIDMASTETRSTAFILLFLSTFLTLFRYSQQTDLVVCTATANRDDAVTEKLIGYFNNVLPVRLRVTEKSTVRDVLFNLRRVILGALDHQHMPLQQIASLPDLVRTSLARMLFSYQDASGGKLLIPGLESSPVIMRKGVADFELAIYVERENERISALVDYDATLFDKATIQRFISHLQQSIAFVTSDLDRSIADLAPIDPIPATVCALLKQHPQVEDAVVTHEPASGSLHAYVVANEYDVPSLADIRALSARSFPLWRLPATYSIVDQLPLLADGAVDLDALPKPTTDRAGLSTQYQPARSKLEALLVDVWRRVLWIDYDLGVNDRFQELGGHSLLSVQIVAETEKSLGKAIPNSCLASLDTVASFAAAIEAADAEYSTTDAGEMPIQVLRGMRSFTASWVGERVDPDGLIVGLNVNGPLPKLFWCLQRYGELKQLAKYLGADQPVYGMRSANRVMEKTEENKEMLARRYVSEILQIQKSGPFYIGGNCQAAEIAFKIARILKAAGHQIGLLMLHERFIPENYESELLLTFGKQSSYNPFNYYPDPTRGWRKYYSGWIGAMLVPGGHGQFFREPNVQVLTKTLSDALAQVRAGTFGTLISRGVDMEAFRLDGNAYHAEILVTSDWPKEAAILHPLEISVRNISSVEWPGTEFNGLVLIGRWRRPGEASWSIPMGQAPVLMSVPPGGSISQTLQLRCPEEPGDWLLELDMVDEGVTYFSWKGSKSMVQPLHLTRRKSQNV